MKKIISLTLATTLTASALLLSRATNLRGQSLTTPVSRHQEDSPPEIVISNTGKPKIQIAILLDSSNSMDGLIDQTRYQLWNIINALTKVTKNGEVPILEVALYHYGNDSLPSSEGHLRRLSDFTQELDLISEELFAIQTNGGQEYAGWVIQSAMNQLEWSQSSEDFRAIFIAGNEPFNQGTVNWREAVNLAVGQNILVNTIYCGEGESHERSLWAMGAEVGNGNHLTINQDQEIVFTESPYDDEINQLSQDLNQTYIPYGVEGEMGLMRQSTEDLNSMQQSMVGGVTRGVSKVSNYYRNSSWDLVDALDDAMVELEEMEPDALPEAMQEMTIEEQEEYVNSQRRRREDIQEKIRELSQLRDDYLQEQQASAQAEGDNTLDQVMIQTLEDQLQGKGFTLIDH